MCLFGLRGVQMKLMESVFFYSNLPLLPSQHTFEFLPIEHPVMSSLGHAAK